MQKCAEFTSSTKTDVLIFVLFFCCWAMEQQLYFSFRTDNRSFFDAPFCWVCGAIMIIIVTSFHSMTINDCRESLNKYSKIVSCVWLCKTKITQKKEETSFNCSILFIFSSFFITARDFFFYTNVTLYSRWICTEQR